MKPPSSRSFSRSIVIGLVPLISFLAGTAAIITETSAFSSAVLIPKSRHYCHYQKKNQFEYISPASGICLRMMPKDSLPRSSSVQLKMATEPTETDSLLETTEASASAADKAPKSTGQTILELAVPAAAALLIDPLMNLADTAFVGHYSAGDPNPLAGMGSASAILVATFYLFNFLCTATTPAVSSKRAAGNEEEAIATGGQALSLALSLGSILTLLLFTFQQPLLVLMGTGSTGPAANQYALDFVSVRAFAAPAVLCIEASSGILRGYLDTKTVVYVLIVANLINLVLDVFLIALAGMGPLGAAIATTTAEWTSAALFLAILAGRLPSADGELGSNRRLETGEQVSIVPIISIPPWEEVQPLIQASSSVFLRTLVLQLSLSSAAAMAARSGGSSAGFEPAAAVAAHQIGLQLWLLCSFFCDSLAAASQGLVADALGRQNAEVARDVSMTVFRYSLVLGFFLASLLLASFSTGALFDLFTQNSSTQTALSEIMPLIIIAQPLNALVFAADGVLQGASQFPFQAKSMLISGLTALATFFVLDYGLGTTDGSSSVDTLVCIWAALIALQVMRGLTSLYKLVDREGPINLLEGFNSKQ